MTWRWSPLLLRGIWRRRDLGAAARSFHSWSVFISWMLLRYLEWWQGMETSWRSLWRYKNPGIAQRHAFSHRSYVSYPTGPHLQLDITGSLKYILRLPLNLMRLFTPTGWKTRLRELRLWNRSQQLGPLFPPLECNNNSLWRIWLIFPQPEVTGSEISSNIFTSLYANFLWRL